MTQSISGEERAGTGNPVLGGGSGLKETEFTKSRICSK